MRKRKSQSQWDVKVTLPKLKEMIQTLSLTSHPSPNLFLFWQGAFSFGVTWKKDINQQRWSDSNYLLLETACLSTEKQKYPQNILITNMQISRLAGAVFSPLRSAPPCLHCTALPCCQMLDWWSLLLGEHSAHGHRELNVSVGQCGTQPRLAWRWWLLHHTSWHPELLRLA